MQRSTSKGQRGLSALDGIALGVFAAPVILFFLAGVVPRSDGQDGWLYTTVASLAIAGASAVVGSFYAARKQVLVGFGAGLAAAAVACLALLLMIGTSLGS